jgi:heme A synthase
MNRVQLLSGLLLLATFSLMVLGGVVHTIGASLACPDWPLCFGQVFPVMKGGVFYEHSHRLLASAVAFLTLWLTLEVIFSPHKYPLRRWMGMGMALVLLQATLGGLTVLWRLPPWVSVMHLTTSMTFLAWVVWLFWQVRQPKNTRITPIAIDKKPLAYALFALLLQIVLGAWSRHLHASMTCGPEVLTCNGAWLPQYGLQWVQTSHRIGSLVAFTMILWATLRVAKTARRLGRSDLRRWVAAIHAVVSLQMLLGIGTIWSFIHLHVVSTHLAMGAVLWILLLSLWHQCSPQKHMQRSPSKTHPEWARNPI